MAYKLVQYIFPISWLFSKISVLLGGAMCLSLELHFLLSLTFGVASDTWEEFIEWTLGEKSLRPLGLARDLLLCAFSLSSYLECSNDYGCPVTILWSCDEWEDNILMTVEQNDIRNLGHNHFKEPLSQLMLYKRKRIWNQCKSHYYIPKSLRQAVRYNS